MGLLRSFNRRFNYRARGSRALSLVLLALLLGASACREGERILAEERFEVGGPIVLAMDVADATVVIEAGERTSVSVGAEYVSERYEFTATAADGTVDVRLEHGRGLAALGVRGEAELRLAIPRGSRVEIEVANGSVTVAAPIEGGVVRTSNGRIEIEESEGTLDVVSSNGSLLIGEHTGALAARTANGDIAVEEHYGGPITAQTQNGSIEYRGELIIDTTNRLSTANGGVSVELLGEPSVILDARVEEGEIGSRYALLDVTREPGALRGRIGAGGAILEIRAANGSIDVR